MRATALTPVTERVKGWRRQPITIPKTWCQRSSDENGAPFHLSRHFCHKFVESEMVTAFPTWKTFAVVFLCALASSPFTSLPLHLSTNSALTLPAQIDSNGIQTDTSNELAWRKCRKRQGGATWLALHCWVASKRVLDHDMQYGGDQWGVSVLQLWVNATHQY
jgi:hypothetical protein